MQFINAVLFFALFVSRVAAIPAALAVTPPAGGVSLALTVDMDGGGCKPGEAKAAIAYDNSAITIILDNFQAAQGPDAGKLKSRAFCRVTIGVNSPGYAFDITSADFRGYVKLDKGVEASLVSRWKWIDASGADLKGKVRSTIRPMKHTLTQSAGQYPQDCRRTLQ